MTQNPPLRFAWMEELSRNLYIFFQQACYRGKFACQLEVDKKKKSSRCFYYLNCVPRIIRVFRWFQYCKKKPKTYFFKRVT